MSIGLEVLRSTAEGHGVRGSGEPADWVSSDGQGGPLRGGDVWAEIWVKQGNGHVKIGLGVAMNIWAAGAACAKALRLHE